MLLKLKLATDGQSKDLYFSHIAGSEVDEFIVTYAKILHAKGGRSMSSCVEIVRYVVYYMLITISDGQVFRFKPLGTVELQNKDEVQALAHIAPTIDGFEKEIDVVYNPNKSLMYTSNAALLIEKLEKYITTDPYGMNSKFEVEA